MGISLIFLNAKALIDTFRINVQSGVARMKWYWWLAAVIFIILGISTLVPTTAMFPSLLGYYAHCSYTPMSAVILWMIAGAYFLYGKRAS
jgi:hypothetical protein